MKNTHSASHIRSTWLIFKVLFVSGGLLFLSARLRATDKTITWEVSSDRVELNPVTKTLHASGNVSLTVAGCKMQAEDIKIDLSSKHVQALDTEWLEVQNLWASGSRLGIHWVKDEGFLPYDQLGSLVPPTKRSHLAAILETRLQ